jgi:hypothetical protein
MYKASNMYDNDMGVHMLQCVVYKPALHCIVPVFKIIQDREKGGLFEGKSHASKEEGGDRRNRVGVIR